MTPNPKPAPAPEAAPSSSIPITGAANLKKKKFRKGKKNKHKQNQQLKGATSFIGSNYFLTAQDDLSSRSDHFKSTMEATCRHMCTKV